MFGQCSVHCVHSVSALCAVCLSVHCVQSVCQCTVCSLSGHCVQSVCQCTVCSLSVSALCAVCLSMHCVQSFCQCTVCSLYVSALCAFCQCTVCSLSVHCVQSVSVLCAIGSRPSGFLEFWLFCHFFMIYLPTRCQLCAQHHYYVLFVINLCFSESDSHHLSSMSVLDLTSHTLTVLFLDTLYSDRNILLPSLHVSIHPSCLACRCIIYQI